YTMVIGIGFLLLVSLVISASLSAAGKFFGSIVPAAMLELVNSVVSLVVITVLFAITYRVVPERTLPWRRLWVGSFATAALFTVGKFLLGLYLGHASVGSAYGAAGSLVVLLVWIYYSACLFLLGAEFTRQYAYEQQGVPIQKAGEEVEKTPEPEPTRIAVAPAAVKPMSAPGLSPSPAPQGSARKIVSDAPKTLKGLLVASAWVGAAVLFRRWYERPQH
ncbi:MAG: YihY/virulence factor BrkB family protein, partial [Acidobacteriaceae bacterium]|nr:YihY/virulence factor BrkB family protein [Acidobacteriaceae bacterium]